MINNYEQLRLLLPETPNGEATFYAQVVKRKKDHPGFEGKNNSARLIKPYYFQTRGELDKKYEEMVAIAEATGARIMIDPFPKDRSKVKFEMLRRLSEIFQDCQEAKLHRLYNSCYGAMKPIKGRGLFLVDWDEKDTTSLDNVIKLFNDLDYNGTVVKHIVPSRQGFHYLITPCNLELLQNCFRELKVEIPDIHKTSPTLMYLPKSLNVYNNVENSNK